jgi:radical SAM protein with 4Fe4S-binding SPASM domain
MLREDVYDLARYGDSLGLRMVMAPCGPLVTPQAIEKMRDAGIRRISLSLDGPDAFTHDSFRNTSGSYDAVIRAAGFARDQGLEFQINSTITRHNVGCLSELLDLAFSLGAVSFHPFFLVPTGRGSRLRDQEISPLEYERTLQWLFDKAEALGNRSSFTVKPTCAPHYARVAGAATGGCLGGKAFAFVSHTGQVQICGFLDLPAGNLRDAAYDLQPIWEGSGLFRKVRNADSYRGKCGVCEYRFVCGGCRARAWALTGDFLGPEPYCLYRPGNAGARPGGDSPAGTAPADIPPGGVHPGNTA